MTQFCNLVQEMAQINTSLPSLFIVYCILQTGPGFCGTEPKFELVNQSGPKYSSIKARRSVQVSSHGKS